MQLKLYLDVDDVDREAIAVQVLGKELGEKATREEVISVVSSRMRADLNGLVQDYNSHFSTEKNQLPKAPSLKKKKVSS